jgi:tetratricopeptide (TPR) repeat protein
VTREEIRDALQSFEFRTKVGVAQDVARAMLAHQSTARTDVDEATAFGFVWAVPEAVKGGQLSILSALIDSNLAEAQRLCSELLAKAKTSDTLLDHWLRRMGPLFEPAAPQVAIQLYRRLLQTSPGDLFATRRLAASLRRTGEHVESEKIYHALLERADLGDKVRAEAREGLVSITLAKAGPARGSKGTDEDADLEMDEDWRAEVQALVEARRKRRTDPDVQEQYLAQAEKSGDRNGMARALGNLGDIYQTRGDHAAAERYSRRALALYEALGDKSGIGETLNDLGNLFLSRKDLNTAIDYFGRAIQAFEAVSDKAGVARSAGYLGLVAVERSDTPTAERHFRRSYALHHEVGDELSAAGVAYSLGVIAWDRRDIADARAKFRETLTVFEKKGMTDHTVLNLVRKALAQIERA